MATSEILLQLLTGGLLGLVGQMLRFLVGYKKLYDVAALEGTKPSDMFQTSRFVISLIIGFVAGIVGVVSLSEFPGNIFKANTKEIIIILIGIGYAGTDFIEGFIKKYIPDNTQVNEGQNEEQAGDAPPPGAAEQPQ